MQARWVIAGTFAVVGAYWLAMLLFVWLEVDAAWLPYGVCALAAFGAGALMVAHAPLRPWREPAAAGGLAIAAVAVVAAASPDEVFEGFAGAFRPWYAGLGVAALSGVTAAVGGLAVRRVAPLAARTDLILALSSLVFTGILALVAQAADESVIGTLAVLAGVAAGGFVTQAVTAPRRPWVCGAGSGVLLLAALGEQDLDGDAHAILTTVIGGMVFLLVGYGGAQLAWWLLRRGDAPRGPDLPPARLG